MVGTLKRKGSLGRTLKRGNGYVSGWGGQKGRGGIHFDDDDDDEALRSVRLSNGSDDELSCADELLNDVVGGGI